MDFPTGWEIGLPGIQGTPLTVLLSHTHVEADSNYLHTLGLLLPYVCGK